MNQGDWVLVNDDDGVVRFLLMEHGGLRSRATVPVDGS